MRIWMNAGYAYLAKRSVIIIVDVSDPANPSREKIWHLPGLPPHGHIPSTEKLDGNGEYICVTGDVDDQELLFVVNIPDPLNLDPLGKVSIYQPNGGVAVQGDYACIVGGLGYRYPFSGYGYNPYGNPYGWYLDSPYSWVYFGRPYPGPGSDGFGSPNAVFY